MQKILIYVDSMQPSGGIERVISNLVNQWCEKYEVILVTKDQRASFYILDKSIKILTLEQELEKDMSGSKVKRIKAIVLNLFGTYKKLKKVLSKENPDIIYTASPLNSLEIFIQRKYMNKVIVSEHGSALAYNQVYKYLKKIVYPKAKYISVPNQMDTEIYLKEGYPAVYIPHLQTFSIPSDLKVEKEKYVLNVGRMTSDKQQSLLLDIWARVHSDITDKEWKLRIIGSGELESKLKQKVIDLDIQDSVVFIQPQKDISQYYANSAIFAFTSKMEGFGMVLLEAMSFATPCISFDCPSGPRDVIVNKKNGFLVDNNNIEEYVVRLKEMIENDELRLGMSTKSVEFCKNWDNEEILNQWEEVFKNV